MRLVFGDFKMTQVHRSLPELHRITPPNSLRSEYWDVLEQEKNVSVGILRGRGEKRLVVVVYMRGHAEFFEIR